MNELYDITAIPYFPYVPGWAEWLIVLSFGVLGLLVGLLRRSRKRRMISPATIAYRELLELQRNKSTASELLNRSSLVARRLLSVMTGSDVAAMSTIELAAFEQTVADAKIRNVLSALLDIERKRFAPHGDETDVNEPLDQLVKTVNALTTAAT